MRLISLVAVLLVTPVVVRAQSGDSLRAGISPGSRVRVLSPVLGAKKQVGTVIALTPDSLRFQPAEGPIARSLNTTDITMIEVPAGTHTNTLKGALIGLLVGGAAGSAVGALSYSPPPPCTDLVTCIGQAVFEDTGRSGAMIGGGLLGAAAGGLIGALVGRRPQETWIRTSLPDRVSQ